jgi:hypothetical protein
MLQKWVAFAPKFDDFTLVLIAEQSLDGQIQEPTI